MPRADFNLVPLPEGLDFAAAAALGCRFATAYRGIVERAALMPGEWLAVHGCGGVGLSAVQIGKALGARVIATVGDPDKVAIARQNGADEVIDYREEDFAERVMALTGGKGVDVIYDSLGGDVFDRSLKCIAWNGRLLVIGFASGRIPEVKANRILLKNIAVTGLHWGANLAPEPGRIGESVYALFELHAAGKIEPCFRCPAAVTFDTMLIEYRLNLLNITYHPLPPRWRSN